MNGVDHEQRKRNDHVGTIDHSPCDLGLARFWRFRFCRRVHGTVEQREHQDTGIIAPAATDRSQFVTP